MQHCRFILLSLTYCNVCIHHIGPVWYNFPSSTALDDISDNNTEPHLLKRGIVEEITLDMFTRNVVYKVVYKDDCNNITIEEEVSEEELAYGNGCPVSIIDLSDGNVVDGEKDEEGAQKEKDGANKNSSDGTVLYSEPSPTDPGKVVYTIMIKGEGSQARYESNVKAERVKYRKVINVIETPKKEVKNKEADRISPLTLQTEAEEVPTSITLKSKEDGEIDTPSNNKRKKQSLGGDGSRSNNGQRRSEGVGGSIVSSIGGGSSSHRQGTQSNRYSHSYGEGGGEERIVMELPVWLQRDRQSQRNIFFWLIGSKAFPEKRTVKNIEAETNTRIDVNLHGSSRDRQVKDARGRGGGHTYPITIAVTAQYLPKSSRNIDKACEGIYQLFIDYLDHIEDAGSKARLIYEVSESFRGDHRPPNSTSRAVRVKGLQEWKDPTGSRGFGGPYMSLLEMPFEFNPSKR